MKTKIFHFVRFFSISTILLSSIFQAPAIWAKDYTFSWSANSGDVEGYSLYYKKGGTASAPFYGTDASEGSSPIDVGNVTTFTITGLEDNTTYHFTLTAYYGLEESDFTDVITVFPDANNNAPINTVLMIINTLLLDS